MKKTETMNEMSWRIEDELQSRFVEMKYRDKPTLKTEWDKAVKAAQDQEFIDGKPGKHYERLRLIADMAATRYDMAYIVEKNMALEQRFHEVFDLVERVSILEGAYSYLKMLSESARIAFINAGDLLKTVYKNKEQKHENDTTSGKKG